MTETTTTGIEPEERAPTPDRLQRFDDALARIGHRPSARDRQWARAGGAAMVVGVVVAVVAYVVSTSQADQRDVISSVILGLVGLAVVITGATIFLRYSLTEFLRFWMLRMLLDADDREGR